MDFHLPQLGEGVYEAEMVRWLVTAGRPADGSGRGGRLLVDAPPLPAAGRAIAPRPPPVAGAARLDYGTPGSTVKLAGVRRKIAEHLVHAKHTIPHFTYVDECD